MPERGGPTTESGIFFQNQVAALYLGRLIDPRPRPGYAAVVEVRLEAPPPVTVDDVVIRFGDGHREYLQVKEAVAPGGDAWTKLWRDFAKQLAMDGFTAADRIVVLLGDSPSWARTLRELCERAAGADDEDEWRGRLGKKHQKLLEGLEPLLEDHLAGQTPFSLFACCKVEVWDPARITSDRVPIFMPPSNVEPWQLYDSLFSKTGQHARIRKSFTKEELLRELAHEGIEVLDSAARPGTLPTIAPPSRDFAGRTEELKELRLPVRLFISYAHDDETLREALEKHLSLLRREGAIRLWNDREIGAGEEWRGQISDELEAADVILLLVSASFIASDYCWDEETRRGLERHHLGEARVIPVIVRDCDWQTAPFAELQALPTGAKAVTEWASPDAAWADVAKGLRRVIGDLRGHLLAPSPHPHQRPDGGNREEDTIEPTPDNPVCMAWSEDRWHGRHLAIDVSITSDPIDVQEIAVQELWWKNKQGRFVRVTQKSGEHARLVRSERLSADVVEPRPFIAVVDERQFRIKDLNSRGGIMKSAEGDWKITFRIMIGGKEYRDILCFNYDRKAGNPLSPAACPEEEQASQVSDKMMRTGEVLSPKEGIEALDIAGRPSTVQLAVQWVEGVGGGQLAVWLVNKTDSPIKNCRTEVTSLQFWSGRRFLDDSKPQAVYVTGAVTTDPEPFGGHREYPLVIHKGSEFEFYSGISPSVRVARNTPGVWRVGLRVGGEGVNDTQAELFFSWDPVRDSALAATPDPRLVPVGSLRLTSSPQPVESAKAHLADLPFELKGCSLPGTSAFDAPGVEPDLWKDVGVTPSFEFARLCPARVLAEFANRTEKTIHGVSASIIYHSGAGNQPVESTRAIWLGRHTEQTVSFSPLGSEQLVLALALFEPQFWIQARPENYPPSLDATDEELADFRYKGHCSKDISLGQKARLRVILEFNSSSQAFEIELQYDEGGPRISW